MFTEIKTIINKNPNNSRKFIKEIKSNELLWEWVLNQTERYDNIKNDVERVYILINGRDKTCDNGNSITFISYSVGYKFCGRANKCKCVNDSVKHKVTVAKKSYSVEKNALIQEKTKQTNLEKYGVGHYSRTNEYKKRIKRTNLERYGVEHAQQHVDIKQKIKQTNLEKYGVVCPLQNDAIKEKTKQTNLERYGVENYAQTSLFKTEIKQTSLERYGVENYSQTNECKEKIKQTNLKKYGTEHVLQNTDIRNKIKQYNLENYNVEYYSQTDEYKEKIKQTNLEKYVVESYTQTEEYKEKTKRTNLGRYGVDHYSKTDEYKEKIKQTNLERYGVENYAQTNEYKYERMGLFYNNIVPRVNNLYIPLFNLEDYNGTTVNNLPIFYQWKCNACATEFQDHLNNGRIPRCPICYPFNQSKWELEIQEYIKQYVDIETNTKQIINPYELDIYIPSKKLAIECNGAYWHSELRGKDKTYHLNKTERCEAQGIQLLHIWDYEYNNNPDLIKSNIKSKLNLNLNKNICASKTNIQIVNNKTKDVFLNNNHIQGTCTSEVNLGLYYNNKLIALMVFDKQEKCEWKLIKYCFKQNIKIANGIDKLFNYFVEKYNPSNIVGYVDRMYSNGNTFKQLGFEFIENSLPDFKYTKDYKTVYNKQLLQNKLESLDPNLSELQNMINNNYTRLWDCGNSVWIWKK